ncbi:Pectinesterase inhibitor domain [Sesbania bispinosa]|nr:Pectinesterase inhibitor domain [Sesbania bispinosa]
MTNQNPIVAFILLTSLLCATSQANEPAPKAASKTSSSGKLEQVAEDAISITMSEISHAKAFLNSIPNLKSIENLKGERGDRVPQCVGGLTDAMKNVRSELGKLEDSWPNPNLKRGTKSLEDMVDGVSSYYVICKDALRNVDETIKIMVLRRIEDIVLLTNDVIFRVAKLQFEDGN